LSQNILLTVNNVKKYFPIGGRSFRDIFYLKRRKKMIKTSSSSSSSAAAAAATTVYDNSKNNKNSNRRYIKAVDDVSFKIEKGKVLVLAGESGSGKTTLARLILRAMDTDSGSIIFEGEDVVKISGNKLKKFRTNVQMIHQDPYASLDPRMKIMDIVMEPLTIHDKHSSKEERQVKVLRSLEDVRLEPAIEIAQKFPHMLSGGQRQRVALARSLVLKPKLIVADEPVSMLDVSVRAEILELMKNLKDRFQISYLYITHDLSTSRYIGDDIAIIYSGKIVEIGPINQVLLNPLHPYTQALIDAIPRPPGTNNSLDNLENERKKNMILIREEALRRERGEGQESEEEEEEKQQEERSEIEKKIAATTSKEIKTSSTTTTILTKSVAEGNNKNSSNSSISNEINSSNGCRFYLRCPYSMEVCRNDPILKEEEREHYVSCFIYKPLN
jgi:peptide/nickel transport system ATP-binding protein